MFPVGLVTQSESLMDHTLAKICLKFSHLQEGVNNARLPFFQSCFEGHVNSTQKPFIRACMVLEDVAVLTLHYLGDLCPEGARV